MRGGDTRINRGIDLPAACIWCCGVFTERSLLDEAGVRAARSGEFGAADGITVAPARRSSVERRGFAPEDDMNIIEALMLAKEKP